MCLFNPGDIVKWRPIERAEYDEIVADVVVGEFAPKMADVSFSLDAFQKDIDGTNAKLTKTLHGH
jgi:urea carboxylase